LLLYKKTPPIKAGQTKTKLNKTKN
jgi:hypothetical protein